MYNYRGEWHPLKKGEQYLILSNHQSVMDPPMVCLSFNRLLYIVATDTLLKNSFRSAALTWCFAPIAKRKAATDISSIKTMKQVAAEGGSLLLFPEGNRAWADYQFAISPAISKLVRMVGLPVILFNIRGGYGVNPRWGRRLRRGRMTGGIRQILSLDEINSMDNERLWRTIVDGLRVIDSESGARFRSRRRAEYLERVLFICPACRGVNTIYSEKDHVRCSCGASAEYTHELHLRSEDGSIPFTSLVDWYKFQLDLINEWNPENLGLSEDESIFSDPEVTLYDQSGKTGKLKLGKGTLVLTRQALILKTVKNGGDIAIPLSAITYKSVLGGVKLLIGTEKVSYYMVGPKRFNPVKYALVLNRMHTSCKEDIYYGTSI